MRITLSEERKQNLRESLVAFHADTFDEELSDYRASRLLEFVIAAVGPTVYNQAIQDARKFMQEKLEDLDAEFYEPEQNADRPVPRARATAGDDGDHRSRRGDPEEMTDHYEYEGARALVELHDERLRSFLATWREAKAQGVTLPETEDPAYADLDRLLHHVVACAGGYMKWCCEVLGVDDPALPVVPPAEQLADTLDPLVEGLLDRWRASPLRGVAEKDFDRPAHASRWKVDYCVDAMLEHAVMHPLRHEHQLRRLLAEQRTP